MKIRYLSFYSPRPKLDPEAGDAPDALAALVGGGGRVQGQRGGGARGGGLTSVLTGGKFINVES